jgi:sigma-B regulation protein RsbU (phosphoserine phosphatase)
MALPPGDALRWVAQRLGDTGERFATCAVIIVDPDDLVCEWANAGHPPVLARVGGQVVELPATGPLLGPIPGRWGTRSIQLASGSVLVGYTDGLTEARSASGEQFGVERLRAVLEDAGADDPEAVAGRCAAAALAFSHGRARDDATIAVLGLHDRTAARTAGDG